MNRKNEAVGKVEPQPDPGSFRDPAGHVFHAGNRVFRSVSPEAAEDFRLALNSEVVGRLMAESRLVTTTLLTRKEIAELFGSGNIPERNVDTVAEHVPVPFISYPYEWPFEALRTAALAHLSLHIDLLRDGYTLSDASAFNMQFDGAEPVHIDMLSIVKYREGARWAGYGQFQRQFLNPLVLESATGVSFAPFYRATLDGITADELIRILPLRYRVRPWALVHLVMPALFDRKGSRIEVRTDASSLAPIPKSRIVSLLEHLHRIISGLKAPKNRTAPWLDYVTMNNYSQAEHDIKLAAVQSLCGQCRPDLLLDAGCNTGHYAAAALEAGAKRIVGVDSDRAALDSAFLWAGNRKRKFLPLAVDLVNPSPAQGWANTERRSFAERLKADTLLALAILHHIVISHNIPLPEAVRALTSMAPRGLIEFVPKDDVQVARLLRFRTDIFTDYNIEAFRSCLAANAKIVREIPLTAGGRTLFAYERPCQPESGDP